MALVAEQVLEIGAEGGVGWSAEPIMGTRLLPAWDLGGINALLFLGEFCDGGGPSFPLEGIVFVVIACLRSF